MTADQFKEARQSLRLTQNALASILDVTPQTIRNWERLGPHSMAQAAIWAISNGWNPANTEWKP